MFPFKTCLNASTLFPFALDLSQQMRVAGEAGFDGLELWLRDIDTWLAAGGTLAALRAQAQTSGLLLPNAITFFAWADADPAARAHALAQAEREMHLLAELGCQAVAAPPFGTLAGVTLDMLAERFAPLAALGRAIGVEPYLEFWGRAPVLARLSEAMYVAIESGVAGAKLLLDPFHMYTGGSAIGGVAYLRAAQIGMVHVNDYPALPGRAMISDADRVLPGAGIAPTPEFARLLHQAGYQGWLSLELFPASYGNETPLQVAGRGLAAIRTAYQIDE